MPLLPHWSRSGLLRVQNGHKNPSKTIKMHEIIGNPYKIIGKLVSLVMMMMRRRRTTTTTLTTTTVGFGSIVLFQV
jgi:hypothetical protein